ncbi:hypothetical protein SNEBB_001186 [Seison nebaliae]|nr:hypothetical protein SNEBB_001186 [Seison nebaliae]
MSYRDIRNFCEMTRLLGYDRIISMENFKKPNFGLVAEILQWLMKRFDSTTDIPLDINSEQDRVAFIKAVAQFMAAKQHIKLNTKKLYQADGYAVKELLKMTTVLYDAYLQNKEMLKDDTMADDEMMMADSTLIQNTNAQIEELKNARQLAGTITEKGANLFELLEQEVDLREIRTKVLNKNYDTKNVQKYIREAGTMIEKENEKTQNMLNSIKTDENGLDQKIEKKRAEYERRQKKLGTLKVLRPAYMDEYLVLEKELEKVYEEYLVKFRIQTYLEQQLHEMNKEDQRNFEGDKIGPFSNYMADTVNVFAGDSQEPDMADVEIDENGRLMVLPEVGFHEYDTDKKDRKLIADLMKVQDKNFPENDHEITTSDTTDQNFDDTNGLEERVKVAAANNNPIETKLSGSELIDHETGVNPFAGLHDDDDLFSNVKEATDILHSDNLDNIDVVHNFDQEFEENISSNNRLFQFNKRKTDNKQKFSSSKDISEDEDMRKPLRRKRPNGAHSGAQRHGPNMGLSDESDNEF